MAANEALGTLAERDAEFTGSCLPPELMIAVVARGSDSARGWYERDHLEGADLARPCMLWSCQPARSTSRNRPRWSASG